MNLSRPVRYLALTAIGATYRDAVLASLLT